MTELLTLSLMESSSTFWKELISNFFIFERASNNSVNKTIRLNGFMDLMDVRFLNGFSPMVLHLVADDCITVGHIYLLALGIN